MKILRSRIIVAVPFALILIATIGQVQLGFSVALVITLLAISIATMYLILIIEIQKIGFHKKTKNQMSRKSNTDDLAKTLVSIDTVMQSSLNVGEQLIDLLSQVESHDKESVKIDEFIRMCIEQLREAISSIEGKRCAVCVKFLVTLPEGGKSPKVYTYLRDSISSIERDAPNSLSSAYPIDVHSWFPDLVRGNLENDLFICNDLTLLEGYTNKRNDWESYYNSAIIAPIRNPDKPIDEDLVGFISVDGKDMEFKSDTSGKLTQIFATSIYHLVSSFRRIEVHGEARSKRNDVGDSGLDRN